MAGISKKTYKTKKGTITRYVITYRDIYGKQHTTGNYATKKEALMDINKYQKTKTDDKNIKNIDIFNNYIDICQKRGRAKSTIYGYELIKNSYLGKYLDIKYSKMNSLDWQQILYEIKENVSAFASISTYRFLRASFNYAIKYNNISVNPITVVEPVNKPIVEHNHFETNELLLLLKICKEKYPQYYAVFFTFIGTGMRAGEIFGLLKENINFEKNTIKVCTQYTKGEFKEATKTKQTRIVYLFPTLANVLKEHIANDKSNSKLVFHNSKGNFLSITNFRKRFWLKLLESCGYPKNYARIHDLRGSYSDLSATLGLSITFAQDQLGHSSPITTLQNYNQTNNTMRKDGISKFENVFEKCEHNVSIKTQNTKTNVLQFRKKQL